MLNTSFFQYCVVYLNPETRPTPEWSASVLSSYRTSAPRIISVVGGLVFGDEVAGEGHNSSWFSLGR